MAWRMAREEEDGPVTARNEPWVSTTVKTKKKTDKYERNRLKARENRSIPEFLSSFPV